MKGLLNVLLAALVIRAVDAQAQESSALRMVQTIALPNVEGRIDHMAVDVKASDYSSPHWEIIPLKSWI